MKILLVMPDAHMHKMHIGPHVRSMIGFPAPRINTGATALAGEPGPRRS
jgi:hypothetical protein